MHALNVSVVAAWKIHCKTNEKKLSHLDFRREITLCLLKLDEPKTINVGPTTSSNLPGDVRFDGVNHFMTSTTQGRCKLCKKNTKTMCRKCNIRLHGERGKQCFKDYHTK